MSILTNNAFSRSLLIRFTEAYSTKTFPYALEYIEEKLVYVIRNAEGLRIDNIKFSLDKVQTKSNHSIINASHILGAGATIKLIKRSEYETDLQVIFCDKKMIRNAELERILIHEITDKISVFK